MINRVPFQLPVELPIPGVGGWEDTAAVFFQMLDEFRADADPPDSLWVRLGFWGLAVTGTAVMFELARQQAARQRTEELALPCTWGLPDRDRAPW
jgi:hypothetical protein